MWYFYALGTALTFAMVFLSFKQLSVQGIAPTVVLVWVFAVSTIYFLIHNLVTHQSAKIPVAIFGFILLLCIPNYLGNIFQIKAIDRAPNAGYALAVMGFHVLFVTISSVFLFGSTLSSLKIIGVICCMVGGILLAL